MLRLIVLLIFGLIPLTFWGQDQPIKTVSYGEGKTETEAINDALRNSIEKTIGGFISTNTSIVNDEIISDDLLAISQGNIESYELISQQSFEDRVQVILSVEVTPEKVIELLEGKGFEASYKGNVFMHNVLAEEYYGEQEPKVIQDYLKTWEDVFLFDYELEGFKEPFRINNNTINERVLYGDVGSFVKSIRFNRGLPGRGMQYSKYQYYRSGQIIASDLNWWLNRIRRREVFLWNPDKPKTYEKILARNWAIEFYVYCTPNNNFHTFFSGLIDLLKALSVDLEKAKQISENGGQVVSFYLFNFNNELLYLRNIESRILLQHISDKICRQAFSYEISTNFGQTIDFLQEVSNSSYEPPYKYDAHESPAPRHPIWLDGGILDYELTLDIFSFIRPIVIGANAHGFLEEEGWLICDYGLPGNNVLTYGYDVNWKQENILFEYKLENGRYYYNRHRVFHVFDEITELEDLHSYIIRPILITNGT